MQMIGDQMLCSKVILYDRFLKSEDREDKFILIETIARECHHVWQVNYYSIEKILPKNIYGSTEVNARVFSYLFCEYYLSTVFRSEDK